MRLPRQRHTKAQDKNDLGHVFGEVNEEYLTALCNAVHEVACEVSASAVLVSGYSMGGFGAVQLGGFRPELFTAVVPVAGYSMGTLERHAPQPESEGVFRSFLAKYAPRLAQVPVVIMVHAPSDTVSSFLDAKRLRS